MNFGRAGGCGLQKCPQLRDIPFPVSDVKYLSSDSFCRINFESTTKGRTGSNHNQTTIQEHQRLTRRCNNRQDKTKRRSLGDKTIFCH